jgi:NADP-dependent 3-hydroxy acid dehydrogenase YdfG
MLLADKNAVIYGAAGAIGDAVARAFAAEGATVFLTGRNDASLDTVAKEITASGWTARGSSESPATVRRSTRYALNSAARSHPRPPTRPTP